MSGIGVATGDGVLLHSCAACGRHTWSADGRELDRDEVLELLREDPPAGASAVPTEPDVTAPQSRRSRNSGAGPAAPAPDQRTELQHLLRGFTVHGGSS